MKTHRRARRNCLGFKPILISGLAIIFLCYASTISRAQSTAQRGFQPGGSYALSDIEAINTENGNMILHVPLASLPPGRGGSPGFQLSLIHNSKLYDTHIEQIPNSIGEIENQVWLNAAETGGWRYPVTPYSIRLISRTDVEGFYPCEPGICGTDPKKNAYIWKLMVIFPDGGEHEFRPQGYIDYFGDGYYNIDPNGKVFDTDCGARWCFVNEFQDRTSGMTYYSTDGTFARLDVPYAPDGAWSNNWTLSFPDGRRVTNNGQRTYDRNGNYTDIEWTTFNNHPATRIVDQLGRSITIEYDYSLKQDYIYVLGTGGEQLKTTVKWKTIYVAKEFRATTVGDPHQRGNEYVQRLENFAEVVDQIILPAQAGSLSYTFGYNAPDNGDPYPGTSYGWGEVSSITLPTGARANYSFLFDGTGGFLGTPKPPRAEWVLNDHPVRKDLTYLAEYDGGSTPTTETWTYDGPGITGSGGSMTITGPDGGVFRSYSEAPNSFGGPPFARLPFKTEHPDGSVTERLWQQNIPYGNPPMNSGVNTYVKTEFTSIRDAAGNLSKTAIKDYNYDKNGNVTRVAEYDWVDYASAHDPAAGLVIPAGAPLKRVTTNSYYNSTPDASDSTTSSANVYYYSASPQVRGVIASAEVSDGTQTLSRAEFIYDNPSTTANLIQQISWDSTKGALTRPLTAANSVSVSHQYDGYGNQILATDARGFQTQLFYGLVGAFSDLYPTQIKTAFQTPVQRTETREYDFSTGLVTRATDVDNNVSASTVYDVFGRPTLVKAAEGKPEETRTSTEYSDVNRRVIVRSDLNVIGDGKLVAIQHYDQLGRIRLARQLEDAATQSATDETIGIKVQTRYLFSGSYSYALSSNPYRAATSGAASGEVAMGWTRSKTDNGGRMIEVQAFGGTGLPAPWGGNTTSTGTVTTAYDANFTTVTDQTSKVRRSMINGLSQLVRVDEPDSNNNLGTTDTSVQPTSYAYDALGNLVTVNQGSQTRTFVYTSLARLTSATNPESGNISYSYDNNGNLLTKADARNITTAHIYDALNRVTNRSYSDGTPAVTYNYDSAVTPNGKGRLASVSSSVSTYSYSGYDALGRALGGAQTIGAQTYSMSYGYDLAGHVKTETYPSGRTVTNTYDNAGRTNNVTGNLGDGTQRNYATGITYDAASRMAQEQFGTTTPIYNKLFYNSRGQLSEIREGLTGNNTTWERGAIINHYSDTCWGMCWDPNTNTGSSMTDNNGNLKKQEHWIQDGNGNVTAIFTQQYDYDSLNRLQRVHDGTNWQQQYSYERYGNRTIDQANTWGTGIPKPNFTVNTANNRLGVPSGQTGTMSYDNAGNLTTDTYSGAGATRVYDAENRMTSETQANNYVAGSYSYDGDGRRVKRIVNGTETWQVYGLGGELIAEYAANASATSPQKEYGYRNGQLLVTVTCGSGSSLTFTDDPLVAGVTVIKAVHLTELRDAVNQARAHAGLSAATWTDSQLVGTVIKAVHITELRARLGEARTALGLSAASYTDPNLAVGDTVKAAHVQELRAPAQETQAATDIRWLVSDQLGTPRMIFDQSGSLATVSRHDYLPFGEELFAGTGGRTTAQGYTNSDGARQKFTQKERDIETGLDYFGARYYSSGEGRFMSVDPSRVSIGAGNPQTWNRYSYTYNNPLAYVDENGKWPTWIHELIIDRALPGLSDRQRKEIKEGSWSVDNPKNGGQDTSHANEHGMARPGQSQEDAAANADTFINNNVDKAKYAFQHTGLTSSLWDFGRAFHTVSDMTSPAHEGYQTWHLTGGASHVWEEASISYYRMGLAVGATLALYEYTYGQQELQRATGYVPGSSDDPTIKAINAQYSLPGSRPAGELEAEYEYRRGLREGLKFDWGRQNGLRGRRE